MTNVSIQNGKEKNKMKNILVFKDMSFRIREAGTSLVLAHP